jgi:hypothetical protein
VENRVGVVGYEREGRCRAWPARSAAGVETLPRSTLERRKGLRNSPDGPPFRGRVENDSFLRAYRETQAPQILPLTFLNRFQEHQSRPTFIDAASVQMMYE